MLQGCPVFVSVSDFRWFDIYERELNKLDNDIIGYSEAAYQQKNECQKNDAMLGNTSIYRNPIASDQDFLEYLVSSKTIPQENYKMVSSSDFFYIENPLVINYWNNSQNIIEGAKVKGGGNQELWYGNKRIPFVHYQGTFGFFANLYLILVKFGIQNFRVINSVVNYKIDENKFTTSMPAKFFWKLGRLFKFDLPREKVIESVMRRNKKGEMYIVGLLNFINANPNNGYKNT